MKRALAAIVAVAYLLTATVPASARRHSDGDIVPTTTVHTGRDIVPTSGVQSGTDRNGGDIVPTSTVNTGALAPDSIEDPCQASQRFLEFHMTIAQLDAEAQEAKSVVLRLHKTSRWHPYKEVENEWADMKQRALPALAQIQLVPTALATSPDGEGKQAALDLTSTYQNALEQLIDYMHTAVAYERAENATSGRPPTDKITLTYSMPTNSGFAMSDTFARAQLDGKATQLGDVLRSLKLPEYRYGKACGVQQHPAVASLGDACELSDEFLDLHATVKRLGDEAVASGINAARLHRTRKWRPYKTIELQWADVNSLSEPILDKLSDLPLELDATPDSPTKQLASDLVSAYQNAVEKLVDYTRLAAYEERVQNKAVSGVNPFIMAISFGALGSRNNTKINARDFSAYTVNQSHFLAQDALQSLLLPEKRYAKGCHVASLAPDITPGPSDPCAMSDNFLDLHAMLLRISDKAHDAGRTAERLHHTSRSRPYRYIYREINQIWGLSGEALGALAILPLQLDEGPDTPQKQQALDLIASYQDAVERITDYAGTAQFLTSTQNALSWVFYPSKTKAWYEGGSWFNSASTSTSSVVSAGSGVSAGTSSALSTGMSVTGSSGSDWFSSGYGVDTAGKSPWQNPVVLPLTFGTVPDVLRTRTSMDNFANSLFESKTSEVPSAMRSIKLPEYRFSRTCHVIFPHQVAKNK